MSAIRDELIEAGAPEALAASLLEHLPAEHALAHAQAPTRRVVAVVLCQVVGTKRIVLAPPDSLEML